MKKILLVDDQDEILEILQIYIEGHFHDVETILAHGGFEAIEIIEEEDIDSIICDYRMPDGDGKVVFDFNEKKSHLPFAWHSATFSDDSHNLVGFSIDQPNYYILPKPVSENKLIDTIETMISTEEDQNVEYRRVRSSILRKFGGMKLEVSISLSEKMILINKKSDKLDLKRIELYETKGVEFFYISNEDYEALLSSLVDELEKKIKRCGTLEDVYFVASEIVDSFNKHLQDKGVTQDQIKLVDACATRCLRELNKHESIKKLLAGVIDSTNYISSHSLMLIHIANLIISDRDTLKDYAKIAVLHDLSLKNERLAKIHSFSSTEFDKLSTKEKEVILDHGKNILEHTTEVSLPEWATDIIKNHHREYSECHTYEERVFCISHSVSHFICNEGMDKARKWLSEIPELENDRETKEIVKKLLDIFS
ncbi:MAG: hypothetical protein BM556_04115 [Bacteriovorax sp. MedPE-SWde]|nr:MAG: hypothetical protein BM556_04115 [Bacteriovorax sp. MedPE-SWde]